MLKKGYRLISNDVVTLDAERAKDYLALPSLPGERAVNPTHAERLKEKMKTDLLLPERIAIAVVWVLGRLFKLNGQHTCEAFLSTDGRILGTLKINWHVYEAESFEAAAVLYAQIDPTITARTLGQICRQLWTSQGLLGEEGLASYRCLSLFMNAVAFEMAGRSRSLRASLDHSERAQLVHDYRADIKAFREIVGPDSPDTAHIMKDPICCAIYQCLLKNTGVAKGFWVPVREAAGLEKNSPAWKLERYLHEIHIEKKAKLVAPSWDMIYGKCAVAWNAFRRGRPTSLRFGPSSTPPEFF